MDDDLVVHRGLERCGPQGRTPNPRTGSPTTVNLVPMFPKN
jgi:hypothetical protein